MLRSEMLGHQLLGGRDDSTMSADALFVSTVGTVSGKMDLHRMGICKLLSTDGTRNQISGMDPHVEK